MIPRYNNLSLALGVPGLVLQTVGTIVAYALGNEDLAAVSFFAGTALLLAGLAMYAKAKGRHPAWCLVAPLSPVGWIILGCLEDRAPGDAARLASPPNPGDNNAPRRTIRNTTMLKGVGIALILCGVALLFYNLFNYEPAYRSSYYAQNAKIGIAAGAVLIVAGAFSYLEGLKRTLSR